MIAAIHALVLTLALVVPYVADAECAWVLWTSPLKAEDRRWEPGAVFQTMTNCGERASSIYNDFNRQNPNAAVEVLCLPDTVDPRGPKGGGR